MPHPNLQNESEKGQSESGMPGGGPGRGPGRVWGGPVEGIKITVIGPDNCYSIPPNDSCYIIASNWVGRLKLK